MIKSLPMALKRSMREVKNYTTAVVAATFMVVWFCSDALASNLTGGVEIAGSYNIKPRKNLEERIKAERSMIVSKDGGIKDAVVFIKGIKGTSSLIQKEVTIDQKRKAFIPHVLPIPVGTTVTFKNSDPFVHRIISNSETKRIRMEFAYEGATMDITFDKPGVVDVWCDDHKRMQGWILVMEIPFFAATDEHGHFTIPNLPPGKYTVEVWHEVLGTQTQEIEVKEGENTKIDFRLPGKEF